ncbi:hypothetical protein ACIP4Y_36415 [Streptomyces sp. NPDC088810]|uniref:hypothetical protein n=1 Tax=Streptomyces sp. NPDC088810 TaxID=3365904 RepID=UPI0037F20288
MGHRRVHAGRDRAALGTAMPVVLAAPRPVAAPELVVDGVDQEQEFVLEEPTREHVRGWPVGDEGPPVRLRPHRPVRRDVREAPVQ